MTEEEKFMMEALKEAQKANSLGEVPIGAIIVHKNKIIARAHNYTEALNDPTAHAEMQAITSATSQFGGKYLIDCTLYVTLEPCLMCATATSWAQIGKIVFGAGDPKKGFSKYMPSPLHPKCVVLGGVLENECSSILKEFFKTKR